MHASFLDQLVLLLTFVAALGSALVGGVFFAFSNFVMKALALLDPPCGVAAMQSINRVVLNPLFLSVFMGTGAVCLLLMVRAVLRWQDPAAVFLLSGGGIYLIGNIVVTMAFNVPRNDSLARVDPASAAAAQPWRDYLVGWTRWNHVRTITALGAAALLMLGWARSWPVPS